MSLLLLIEVIEDERYEENASVKGMLYIMVVRCVYVYVWKNI